MCLGYSYRSGSLSHIIMRNGTPKTSETVNFDNFQSNYCHEWRTFMHRCCGGRPAGESESVVLFCPTDNTLLALDLRVHRNYVLFRKTNIVMCLQVENRLLKKTVTNTHVRDLLIEFSLPSDPAMFCHY